MDHGSDADRFYGPRGMTVDEHDYLYIADQYNDRIQIYDSAFRYHATLETPSPYDVATDRLGNIYVVSFFHHSLRTYNQAHELVDVVGTADPRLSYGTFRFPRAVVHNGGEDVFIMDTDNRKIQKYTNSVDYQLLLRRTTAGPVRVSVEAGVVHDLAGNPNQQAVHHTVSYPVPPKLFLSADRQGYTNRPFALKVIANEPVAGFVAADVELTNATLFAMSTPDSLTFTLLVAPGSEGEVLVKIPAGAVVNPYGYTNEAVLTYQVVYDTLSPSVQLTSLAEDTSHRVSISFSETVSGFTAEGIQVQHATVDNLRTSDSITFVATLVRADQQEAQLHVLAEAARDASGNFSTGSDTLYLPPVAAPPPVDTLHVIMVNFMKADTLNFPCTVRLYEKSNQQFRMLVSQRISSNSDSVTFNDLMSGQYMIGVEPDDTARFPAYYNQQVTLSEADIITLRQDTSIVYRFLTPPPTPAAAGGTLQGVLVSDTTASNGRIMVGTASPQGEPLSGVATYLIVPSSGEIQARSVTNKHGQFKFTNLPTGEYLFKADHNGLPLDEQTNRISILSTSAALSVTVVAGNTIQIVDRSSPDQVTAVEQKFEAEQLIHHYPNPVEDVLRIDLYSKWLGGTIEVINPLGKVVLTERITTQSTAIRLDKYNAGVYIIALTQGAQRESFRIIKR